MITPDLVQALNPRHPDPQTAAAKLQMAADKFGISTPLRQAHWLAQLAEESSLVPQSENLNYSANRLCQVWPNRFPTLGIAQQCAFNPQAIANRVYGGRMGNDQPGDGYKYRGRGFIQLTGKANYTVYGRAVGFDLAANPDLLLQYGVSALVAGAYWQQRNLNAAADRDDLRAVTLAINGGLTGFDGRRNFLAIAKRALKI